MPTLKLIVLVGLVSIVAAQQWGQICRGNPTNEIKGCDSYGCGHYGAEEKGSKGQHRAVDVICKDGSEVLAPFSGTITQVRDVVHTVNAVGVQIHGEGFCVKLIFVQIAFQIKGGRVRRGEVIGTMQNMQQIFPGIISNIHVENCDRSDPTPYLIGRKVPPPPFPGPEPRPPPPQGGWNAVCAGNPTNKIRGCDSYGCGYYGAPRQNGKGKHTGVDVICRDGSTVFAPFSGKLSGPVRPFNNGNAIDNGVQITGEGFCVKLLAIRPYTYSGSVKRGQRIGTMLPMQKVFPGITSHIHVENCDRSDPTFQLTNGQQQNQQGQGT